ncbi:hypothetical protein [Bacillus pumilus]|uniref:hypothetical protein n=1 Tax=Bacillus pumilus TaxID=1408 RepID=UPI00119F4D9F|nr:hypothetical protein [Bacillus pumilus]
MVEVTVISMEQRVQEVREPFDESYFIETVKRVPYIVANAEIKHKGNMIKSEYTFFDAEDMSFKEAQERIIDMLANGLAD